MKPKLGLFLSSNPSQGGTYQYSLSVLNALLTYSKKYDIQITYIDSSWEKTLAVFGVTGQRLQFQLYVRLIAALWREFNLPLKWWHLFASKCIPNVKMMRAERCSLWLFPAQDCWSYQACVPSLVAIHDLMHRYERSFPEVSRWRRFQRLERHYRQICMTASGIVVDSEMGRQQVIESYSPEPDKVFPLPYVPPSYLFSESDADEYQIQNLPKKYLFYPAQFWAHKNHSRLLKAVACLVLELPDLQLVLVGGPKGAYQAVNKLIMALGIGERVKILGYVSMSQMCTIYRGARFLIMPSLFGPTNIPPLEAMALGCPVAVSNNYAMAEQVGSAGLLFDPYSVEEISAVIARLWNDDRLCAEMSKRGIEKSREWTQEHFNKQLESIISRVLKANNEI